MGLRNFRRYLQLCFIAFQTLNCADAFAQASGDCQDTYYLSVKISSRCESQHNLPLGAGIGSPSVNTNPLENPAGYIYNKQLKAHVSTSRLSSDINSPVRTGVIVVHGNGMLGGGAGYQSYKFDNASRNRTVSKQVGFGLANAIDAVNAATGISFARSIQASSVFSPVKGADSNPVNFGTLLNPKGAHKFGFTAFDILNGTKAGGIGYSTNLSAKTALAVDVLGSISKRSYILKSSLGTSISALQMSLGYGYQVGSERVIVWVPTGVSFGGSIWLGDHLRVLITINQVEAFYLGATLTL